MADRDRKTVEGEEPELSYAYLVLGLGAMSRFLPVPGLAEHAIGFQTLPESLDLRDVVLERMEAAEASRSPAFRCRALTFVFAGGDAGVDPKEVSVRAGHSSVAFTLDRYGHLFEDDEDTISERLDAVNGVEDRRYLRERYFDKLEAERESGQQLKRRLMGREAER